MPPRRLRLPAIALAISLAIAPATSLVACGSGDASGDASGDGGSPTIVVTYSILGDVVQQLVGDAATVQVIIPNGQDPHEYEPSAKDVAAIQDAGLVVANGLDLEEGLASVLEQAADDGVDVFVATDHITVRSFGAEDPTDDHGAEGAGEEGGGQDPHFWTDPTKMAELAPDLAADLERVLGVQLDTQLAAFDAAMTSLDAEIASIMAVVPAGGCRLVTGHESLGYFAARYGCTLVGAVIPSLSSSAETSAEALAELHAVADAAGVQAIFTEVGTPKQIVEQVADEVGVPLVELPSHKLPDSGGYPAYLTDLAIKIATALTPP